MKSILKFAALGLILTSVTACITVQKTTYVPYVDHPEYIVATHTISAKSQYNVDLNLQGKKKQITSKKSYQQIDGRLYETTDTTESISNKNYIASMQVMALHPNAEVHINSANIERIMLNYNMNSNDDLVATIEAKIRYCRSSDFEVSSYNPNVVVTANNFTQYICIVSIK